MDRTSPAGSGGAQPLEPGKRARAARALRALRILAVVVLAAGLHASTGAAGGPCDAPVANAIACENTRLGNAPSEWDVVGAGDPTIQGFAAQISVAQGETVHFTVDTTATEYRLDVYRLGYYGGLGARKVATVLPSATLPQTQPACLSEPSTGLVDCGSWAESASWDVPGDAVSGIYIARLVRLDTLGASHIVFVVRDDNSHSDLLFQTSDSTWEAYNQYGGNSLYSGSPAGRAYKVSYNRPFTTRAYSDPSWLFEDEVPMVRFLERNGYDVSYTTDVDTARRGPELLEHKAFLSVGHDEYWSAEQRANVEAARDAGVNLAFFSGNEVFWKTRWEPSIDGSATPYRTLVSYKETKAGAKIDPSPTWTGTWRDKRLSPPADGGRPENSLTGTLFTVDAYRQDAMTVPAEYGRLRFWRDTSVAALSPGQTATFPAGILGHEWDEDVDNGFRPAGLFHLSSTTATVDKHLIDEGTTYVTGSATHHLTLYRAASGALVFGAGTAQWSWGLDDHHDWYWQMSSRPGPDSRIQQATVNLFADMGTQPATLQDGLVSQSASSDRSAPTSSISSPAGGTSLQNGSSVTITGTAGDGGGGAVAAVEVSVDGGATWHPTVGRESWTYTWSVDGLGAVTIKSRAVDDSGNIGSAGAGVTVNVTCPCTLWSAAARPGTASAADSQSVELGVRFRSDRSGYASGIRFYKGSRNTGTHVGSLWMSTGTLLARATFSGETATGWQEVSFDQPVPIDGGTTYVASYFAPQGGYAVDLDDLHAGHDSAPLRALPDGLDGANGLYRYTSGSAFPTNSYHASNYWVDVVFYDQPPTDTTPPGVASFTPQQGATNADPRGAVTATFTEAIDPASVSSTTFQLRDSANALVPTTVTYAAGTRTASLVPASPLADTATYRARVVGGASGIRDVAGNTLAADSSWSFTTAVPRACPCSLWSAAATPRTESTGNTQSVELGVRFRTDRAGYISGIRFYKGSLNTGTHVGSLWTSSGTLLARAAFSGETATGWQQVTFDQPVAITADTTYVASYLAPQGGYAVDLDSLHSGYDNPPLRALADGLGGGNGVYRYTTASAFPTDSYSASNYWVDVVFTERLSDLLSVAPGTAVQVGTSTPVASGNVDTLALAFGTVPSQRTFTNVFTVKNVSTEPQTVALSIAGVPQLASAVFASSGSDTATLAPGASSSVTVVTSAVSAGRGSGSIRIALPARSLARDAPTTIDAAPQAPASLSAVAIAGTKIRLTWLASSTTTTLAGYVVYRSVSGGSYTKITAQPISTLTYDDSAVTNGIAYSYRVRAVASGSPALESVDSPTSTETADGTAPVQPITVALANGGGSTGTYINAATAGSISVAVGVPKSAQASDTVIVKLSNGIASVTKTVPSRAGAGTVSVSGIDGTSLGDGTVTISATIADAAGNVSPATTTTAPKDAVAPNAPTAAYTDTTLADQINGIAEKGAQILALETLPIATGPYTAMAAKAGSYIVNVAAVKGQTVTYQVTATDAAGNASAATMLTFADTR